MLMAPPRRRREPPRWLRRRSVARFEMGCVSAFHLIVTFLLLAWPREQIVTPGTSVIFGTIPLLAWAVWFTLIGVVAAACVHRNTDLRQALTWIGVFPTGAAWIYGFSVAVSHGKGNAIFAVTWVFLLLWWLTLAMRLHFGGSGNQWDGE